ncbi:uncharacterized protein [Cicer arietinum]|uniref:Heterogeneous nuclear ribonucleoprotein U-like protein 1 n=1 Tax=Cicer arietinum TaxID=3827 RepID=A0A1S2X9L8_CICAR|nr:heterogeneous nuclear ribonucleoprotein U-like protein 1 [Cicer arietinum]
MSSTKRNFPFQEDVANHPKKPKESASEPLPSPRVVLNSSDTDLDFNIECNGVVGYGLHEEGFGYCWSGARANVGITKGRYCFSCIVVSSQRVDIDDTAPDQQNLCRLGVSRGDDAVGALGESTNSFGFGGTGKFSNAGKFFNFGDRFGVGDTIVCCIDLESKPLATIGFSKNGKWLGTAFQFDVGSLGLGALDSTFPKDSPWGCALFPHVLLKNVVVQMQFSVEQGLVPREGFRPWALAVVDGNAVLGPSFSEPKDCELMMMVGLPASGKTVWAEKWVKDHPEKRYVLLGTNLILEQMKVPGLLRKNNYSERFDRLMDKATAMFNVILSRAASVPRNYIIDQTNVYRNARKRKLKPFADYQKIAVVVFPKPEDLKRRYDKRFKETGKKVPTDALNNMIANYVLPKSKDMPHSDEYFDKVLFVELNRDESQKYLDQMKQNTASLSNNNPSTLSCRGSFQSSAGSGLQNQGSLAGSSIPLQASYSPISPSNYGMPSQVSAGGHMTEPRMTVYPLSGGYPSSQISQAARVPSPCGLHSYDEASCFPRDNAGYDRTYGVIPTGGIEAYTNPVLGSHYRPNIAGSHMGFHGTFHDSYRNGMHEPSPIATFHDSYRNGMHEPSPIASARTTPFDYSTYDRPYVDNRDFLSDLHTPAPTTYSLPPYGAPTLRPHHGGLPDNLQYSGKYASQHPRYYP